MCGQSARSVQECELASVHEGARNEEVKTLKHHSPGPSSARPLDLLLAEYASGSLSASLHALIGAHLEMNSSSAAFVAGLEAVKGSSLQDQAPIALTSRDAMLQRIFAARGDLSAAPVAARDSVFPAPLRRYVGVSARDLPWRRAMPGVRQHVVEDHDGVEATVYWIKAGAKMPHHTHDGDEVTLVLRGGFTDITGHYGVGDVAVADGDVDHRPVADDDEDCICFAVTTAPLRLTGPVGKLIQSIFRN